ncbi:MAG: hypothetical protein ABL907_22045 [Hyphomicrobium sp.]
MSLRVRGPLPAGDIRRGPGGAPMPPMDDGYMSRLVKLVPAEAVGPFPFLMDYARQVPMPDGSPRYAIYFVAWVLLAIVIVLRVRTTSAPGVGPQWGAVLIAGVAFFIWVHVLGGDCGCELLLNKMTAGAGPDGITRTAGAGAAAAGSSPEQLKNFVANVSLMAWTTLAPVVYRGEDEQG